MNKKTAVLILLCFFLCVAVYINNNIGQIYAIRGNYYFKKNDIQNAQKYYEKAFESDYNNSETRDIYVNSIINSPLNIKAQEKLVKFLKYPMEDLTKDKLEYFLYDLKREIHRNYPKNYIQQAPFNQQIIRWDVLPIKYGFRNKTNLPAYFEKEIENAFLQWENSTNRMIYFEKDNQNPDIIITFEEQNFDYNDTGKFVVAYTNPVIHGNILENSIITFYTKYDRNNYFSQNQIYNTALHEIAHALGFMGHSYSRKNIMHMSMESEYEATVDKRILTEADINTIKLLYKIKPEITNSENPSGEYLPRIVLGGKDDIVYAKTKEAKNYINNAPQISNGHIDLAENHLANKDYVKAVRSLEKALTLADTKELKYMINYNLAIVYLKLNDNETALNYAKSAQKFNNSEDVKFILAEIYTKLRKNTESISLYKQLILQNPQNIEYTIRLTNIYINNKNYLKARKVLKNYIEHNPQERNNSRFKSYGILKFGL